jgi:formylglycine-generating enzyme required for sulfatase activity
LRDFAQCTAQGDYTQARVIANPNRYDDWIPRCDRFDDGAIVTVDVGRYQPNPWGLHDMHGNAAEWTRSAYRPYPYHEHDGRNDTTRTDLERVVRGGSWRDRPHQATASYRRPYQPYHRVFNVGFRVVAPVHLSE